MLAFFFIISWWNFLSLSSVYGRLESFSLFFAILIEIFHFTILIFLNRAKRIKVLFACLSEGKDLITAFH